MQATDRNNYRAWSKLLISATCALVLLPLVAHMSSGSQKRKIDMGPRDFVKFKEAALLALKENKLVAAEDQFHAAERALDQKSEYIDQEIETLLNLSEVYKRLNQMDKARQSVKSAVDLVEKKFGKNSGRLPPILNKLALLYQDRRQQTAILKESLRIQENLLGPKNPSLLITLMRLSATESDPARIEYMRRAYDLRKRMAGFKQNGNSEPIAYVLSTLYLAQGNFAEAVKLGNEAVDLAVAFYGKGSPAEIESTIALAEALRKTGKSSDADALIDKCFTMVQNVDPGADTALNRLNRSLGLLQQNESAATTVKFAEAAMSKVHKFEGNNLEQLLPFDLQVLRCLYKSGRIDLAKNCLQKFKADCNTLEDKSQRKIEIERARKLLSDDKMLNLADILS